VKRYSALSKNFFRQLARGEAVAYFDMEVEASEEKIIVRSPDKEGLTVEFHYRRKTGDQYGFSKEQLSGIFAGHERPLYSVRLRAAR
jgi:hypothetical protein